MTPNDSGQLGKIAQQTGQSREAGTNSRIFGSVEATAKSLGSGYKSLDIGSCRL